MAIDLERKRERFLRDPAPVRLANLASNLARLATWVDMGREAAAVVDLMREIAWQVEWCADVADERLVDVQREVVRWRRVWPLEAARSLLSFRARHMAEQVLDWSGLRAA